MHTNTRKFLSGALVAGMALTSTIHAASNIGTGSVQGSGALDSAVVWDDTFPGTATGIVNGLSVTARIQPQLNMVISGSGLLDLGTLDSANYSTGSVEIEIGTNAVNGASVTARSSLGGLRNTSNTGVFINDLVADEVADSYRFTSVDSADDSSYASFTHDASLASEVNNNTTSHVIYTSNKPQALTGVDDFTFYVSAKPDAQSPVGDYTDTVVVTVTGNF